MNISKSVVQLAGGTQEEEVNLLEKLLDPQHYFTPRVLAAIQQKTQHEPIKTEVSKRLSYTA